MELKWKSEGGAWIEGVRGVEIGLNLLGNEGTVRILRPDI